MLVAHLAILGMSAAISPPSLSQVIFMASLLLASGGLGRIGHFLFTTIAPQLVLPNMAFFYTKIYLGQLAVLVSFWLVLKQA